MGVVGPGKCDGQLGKEMKIRITAKYISLAILAVLVLLIATLCVYYVPNPIKIIDPYHPWFKPDKFRFEDYTLTPCTRKEALAKLFPIGTKEEFVDRVLVEAGNAQKDEIRRNKVLGSRIRYFYEAHHWSNWFYPRAWNVTVMYDNNNEVTDVRFPEGRNVVTGEPGESAFSFYMACKKGKQYGRNW